MDTMQYWDKARILWLGRFKSIHTIRQYDRALRMIEDFSGKPVGGIGIADVNLFKSHMVRTGLADTTISARLAAVSSFFDFMLSFQTETGEKIVVFNPVDSVKRPVIQRFQKVDALSLEQARALIEITIKQAETGKRTAIANRNAALIFTYMLTGQRNSEVRQLKWGQIRQVAEKTEVQWTVEDADAEWQELPKPVWQAILAYLESAGRLTQIHSEEYVFVALESPFGIDRNGALPPLSERMVLRIVQSYAKRAGLKNVTVHTLRHTFASLLAQAGARPKDIQRQLGLAQLDMTKIYLKQLTSCDNNHWQTVAQMLEVTSDLAQEHESQRNGAPLKGSKKPNYFRRLRM